MDFSVKFYSDFVKLQISPKERGCHVITAEIEKAIQNSLVNVKYGTCTLTLEHTTAGLSINEAVDVNAQNDISFIQESLVKLTDEVKEGSDDLEAHKLCNLIGCTLTIPIKDGKLILGTWQGIYLNEFKKEGHGRTINAVMQGRYKD